MWQPQVFVIDVDGVMTTGQFLYTPGGKAAKIFGPDDRDALGLLKDRLAVHFVTADSRGWRISYRRIVEDMGYPLALVGTEERGAWIACHWDPAGVIYMGDGLMDVTVFNEVGHSICPADGFYLACERADYVTRHSGGNRAVAEACVYILAHLEDGIWAPN